MIILKTILVFFAAAGADVCWAKYALAMTEKNALHAASWAVAIYFTGSWAVILYTSNSGFLLPAYAGAFAGTYWAVWHSKRVR